MDKKINIHEFNAKQKLWAALNEKNSSSSMGPFIERLYRYKHLRKLCISILKRIEGGIFFSLTIRKILENYHEVSIGKYSYGACMEPGALPRGTIIGAYCSIATGLKVFRRNHPLDTLTQHPFFYNKNLGLVDNDTIPLDSSNPLVIGNDVWIGDSVTILPSCKKIGNGAVIGSGSVVTKSIEEYSIFAGNPAKKIKDRYDTQTKEAIRRSEWWKKSLPELLDAGSLLTNPIDQKKLLGFISHNQSE